jgi:hypothetical protein
VGKPVGTGGALPSVVLAASWPALLSLKIPDPQLPTPAGRPARSASACCAAAGATTAAGTWAPTADDAKFIEMLADMEDKWQQVGAVTLHLMRCVNGAFRAAGDGDI